MSYQSQKYQILTEMLSAKANYLQMYIIRIHYGVDAKFKILTDTVQNITAYNSALYIILLKSSYVPDHDSIVRLIVNLILLGITNLVIDLME